MKRPSVATSLDELSHGPAGAKNAFLLEDLAWEHFALVDSAGEVTSNRAADRDIAWSSEQVGGLAGKRVLELGSYEGYHSRFLEQLGADSVTAIEGNPLNFFKCLAVKNLYGLDRTTFLLGNCERYLEENHSEQFDFIVASGILYHLFDPLAALELLSQMTDHLFVCTTYYHPELQRFRFTGETRDVEVEGMSGPFRLYERLNSPIVRGKKHGMVDRAWMFDYPSLIEFLRARGYATEVLRKIETEEPFQVRVRLFASRTALGDPPTS